MEEIWKRLVYPEFPKDNHFMISSYGRLKNEETGNILKQDLLKSGYYSVRVVVKDRNDKRHIIIHKAVAYTFIDNPNGYNVVNHIDGNKTNNHVENLEWCTYEHNLRHSYDTGLFNKEKISGENNHEAKLTWDDIAYIREYYIPKDRRFGQRAMARKFGVSRPSIRRVLSGDGWRE